MKTKGIKNKENPPREWPPPPQDKGFNNAVEMEQKGMKQYYTIEEVISQVDNMEALEEYLYGWEDAVVNGEYKKTYVNMYLRR